MKNMESFNRLSKVDYYYSENLKSSLLPDYDGLSYVRLMKKFVPPPVEFEFSIPEFKIGKCPSLINFTGKTHAEDTINLNKEINKPFYIRCYLPNNNITRKTDIIEGEVDRGEKRANRVVIMFNGLNELDHFDLYDILGEFFANNGMSAILLPTPFHLNRRVYRRVTHNDTGKESIVKVSLIELASLEEQTENGTSKVNGDLFYHSFLKGYSELDELIKRIRGTSDYKCDPAHTEIEKLFYETYFNNEYETNEIVLFGYSLGGLKAVSYFLKEPEKYRCCISFNSGANLLDSNVDGLKIKDNVWKKALRDARLKVSSFTDRRIEKNEREIGFSDETA